MFAALNAPGDFQMTLEHVYLVLGTALINGAVTFGVIKTQLAWLRRDTDLAHKRLDELTARVNLHHERREHAREDYDGYRYSAGPVR